MNRGDQFSPFLFWLVDSADSIDFIEPVQMNHAMRTALQAGGTSGILDWFFNLFYTLTQLTGFPFFEKPA